MTETPKFSLLANLKAKKVAEAAKPKVIEHVEESKPAVASVPKPSLLAGVKAVAQTSTSSQVVRSESQEGGTAVPSGRPSLLQSVARANQRQEDMKKDHSYLFVEMPTDFKELLDRFDSLLVRDTGIDDFNIDLCRNYVKKIMVDLKTQPELDGLIIDRDVRNIIRFIRATKEVAIEAIEVKKTKSESRKSKPKAAARFANLGALDFGGGNNPANLEDFSDLGDLDI